MSEKALFPLSYYQDANLTRYFTGEIELPSSYLPQCLTSLTVAGLVMLFYDHLLTFDKEMSLLWRAKRSFARTLFLLNRYTVLVVQLSATYCLCAQFHSFHNH